MLIYGKFQYAYWINFNYASGPSLIESDVPKLCTSRRARVRRVKLLDLLEDDGDE
jgi:hypothetical protein